MSHRAAELIATVALVMTAPVVANSGVAGSPDESQRQRLVPALTCDDCIPRPVLPPDSPWGVVTTPTAVDLFPEAPYPGMFPTSVQVPGSLVAGESFVVEADCPSLVGSVSVFAVPNPTPVGTTFFPDTGAALGDAYIQNVEQIEFHLTANLAPGAYWFRVACAEPGTWRSDALFKDELGYWSFYTVVPDSLMHSVVVHGEATIPPTG